MQIPPIFQYRFLFEAAAPARLPSFASSAWRGAFGHALKRCICVMSDLGRCEKCLLYHQCAFPELFDPPRSPHLPRRYKKPPPFVFSPEEGRSVKSGDSVSVELRLLGDASRHFPYVLFALKKAAESGIGSGRTRLLLRTVSQFTQQGWQEIMDDHGRLRRLPADPIPAPEKIPGSVRVVLRSPMRLRIKGRNMRPEQLDSSGFLLALYLRTWLLSPDCEGSSRSDWKNLGEAASSVRFDGTGLGWREIVRRSARQGLMRVGGIVGGFELRGDLAPFWDFLWYGQWLHVGHLACMGLGAYRLEAAKPGGSAAAGEAV